MHHQSNHVERILENKYLHIAHSIVSRIFRMERRLDRLEGEAVIGREHEDTVRNRLVCIFQAVRNMDGWTDLFLQGYNAPSLLIHER